MKDEEYVLVDDHPRVPVIRELPDEPSGFKRNLTIAIWTIILVLLALFVGQNWRDIPLDFLVWEFDMKLSFALLASAFLGLILGLFIAMLWKRR